MKKTIISISLVSLIIFSGNCTKEKPPIGNYIGVFDFENSTNLADKTVWLRIEETEKDYILIGTTDYNGNLTSALLDTLYKKGKNNIEGKVPSNDNGLIYIKGEWSHKLFSKKYLIKGTFTETHYAQGGSNQYQNSGTFEIKSN